MERKNEPVFQAGRIYRIHLETDPYDRYRVNFRVPGGTSGIRCSHHGTVVYHHVVCLWPLQFSILVLQASYAWTQRHLGDAILHKLRVLLGVFVASVFYFVLVYHLTNLYATEHHGVERFILVDGGIYTFLFWVVQMLFGCVVPLVLVFIRPFSQSRHMISLAALLVIVGRTCPVVCDHYRRPSLPPSTLPRHGGKQQFF